MFEETPLNSACGQYWKWLELE